jgi:anti-sigma regulatory factor (Ser/Thr protein kinase)
MRDEGGSAWVPFGASAQAPGRVRHWLAEQLTHGTCEAATLAVSEIVTNALIHSRLEAGEAIEVQTVPLGERVRVNVRHRGEPFPAATSIAPPGPAGGWGLMVVEAVSTAWGVEPAGERVVIWFEV